MSPEEIAAARRGEWRDRSDPVPSRCPRTGFRISRGPGSSVWPPAAVSRGRSSRPPGLRSWSSTTHRGNSIRTEWSPRGTGSRSRPSRATWPTSAVFDDRTFDLIVHPISNCFVPDLDPVWTRGLSRAAQRGRAARGLHQPRALPLQRGHRILIRSPLRGQHRPLLG